MKFSSPYIFFILIILSFFSCKTNQFNKQGKRIGRWEFSDTLGTQIYKYGGRYRKGVECGTWKYYFDNRLTRVEKYHKNISENTFFHDNGQLHSKGLSKLDVSDSLLHWYYFGDWKFFDENGKLMTVKTFEKGKAIKVRKVAPETTPKG